MITKKNFFLAAKGRYREQSKISKSALFNNPQKFVQSTPNFAKVLSDKPFPGELSSVLFLGKFCLC